MDIIKTENNETAAFSVFLKSLLFRRSLSFSFFLL